MHPPCSVKLLKRHIMMFSAEFRLICSGDNAHAGYKLNVSHICVDILKHGWGRPFYVHRIHYIIKLWLNNAVQLHFDIQKKRSFYSATTSPASLCVRPGPLQETMTSYFWSLCQFFYLRFENLSSLRRALSPSSCFANCFSLCFWDKVDVSCITPLCIAHRQFSIAQTCIA